MRETEDDLDALQRLLDASFAGSGEHLRTAFDQEHRLAAAELVDALAGLFEMHLAVLTSSGDPMVAPVDGFVLRGRICLGLPKSSVRARLLRRDPRVSVSFNSEAVAFIAHGRFVEVTEGHPMFDVFEETSRQLYIDRYGDWFGPWLDRRLEVEGRGVAGYVEPRVLFAKGGSP